MMHLFHFFGSTWVGLKMWGILILAILKLTIIANQWILHF